VLGFPDPFAVATLNGEQTNTTSVIKRTLNPYWNETFEMCVPRLPLPVGLWVDRLLTKL
jgi:Ca2+-dependent lipid-binding protein